MILPKLGVSGQQLQFEFTDGYEKNRWFGSNLSKITRPVAAIKSLRFALLLPMLVLFWNFVTKFGMTDFRCQCWFCTWLLRPDHLRQPLRTGLSQDFRMKGFARARLECYQLHWVNISWFILQNSCLCFRFGEYKGSYCTVAAFKAGRYDNRATIVDFENAIRKHELRTATAATSSQPPSAKTGLHKKHHANMTGTDYGGATTHFNVNAKPFKSQLSEGAGPGLYMYMATKSAVHWARGSHLGKA